MNYIAITGIILLILTPLSIFKLPNTPHHIKIEVLAAFG
jgi:hypothetical protein